MAIIRIPGGRKGDAWIVFAFLIVVQIICLRGTSRLHASVRSQPSAAANKAEAFSDSQQVWKRDVLTFSSAEQAEPQHRHHTKVTHTMSTTTSSHKPTSTSKHPPQSDDSDAEIPCQPLPLSSSPAHVCSHVTNHCPPSGHFDYLRFYYCAGTDKLGGEHPVPPQNPDGHHTIWHAGLSLLRILRLIIILVWMLFLFSWVGVVASDFFCPNLSTIASRLGLNESTAGVTFLAFGNGSPDVFSTFGAMKTDSGSLAIGELLGAASFIVSVISGSMMLIAPFRVKPWPFCRDVGFFTVAVALTLIFLVDGKLLRSETIALICLYLLYAATVIIGSWWQERRRQKRLLVAAARDEYDNDADGRSIASNRTDRSHLGHAVDLERSQLLSVPSTDILSHRLTSPSEYQPDFDPFEDWANQQTAPDALHPTRASTPEPTGSTGMLTPGQTPGSTSSKANQRTPLGLKPNLVPRHSLLSAIEFRDVVSSLRKDSATDRSQEIFQSWDPESFLPHHHHNRQRSAMTRRPSRDRNMDGSPKQSRGDHNRITSLGPGVGGTAGTVHEMPDSSIRRERNSLNDLTDLAYSAPTSSSMPGASVNAVNVDDPWREHLPGDDCEPLGSPALPVDQHQQLDPFQSAASHKNLSRLEIPKWSTRASRSQDRRDGSRVRKSSAATSNKISSSVNGFDSDEGGIHLVASPRIRPERAPGQLLVWKIQVVFHALFPSLRHLHAKSWLGVVVSFVTSPAILLLNLTLPVVDDEADGNDDDADTTGAVRLEGDETAILASSEDNQEEETATETVKYLGSPSVRRAEHVHWSVDERVNAAEEALREDNMQRDRDISSALRHLPENAGSPLSFGRGHSGSSRPPLGESPAVFRAHSAGSNSSLPKDMDCTWEDEAETQEMHKSTHRFLVLMQCIFAPTFVTWAIASTSGVSGVLIKVILAAFIGLAAACVAFIAMKRKDMGKIRYSDRALAMTSTVQCSMGFIVSVMWIMTIVDEVVSILQTVGLIVGLSDAILGLTVFAMGNSLGDLVANITIARLGHPVMAISACFAGPMLNLLLGIGISGTWLLSGPTSHQPWSHDNVDGIYPIDFSPTLLVSGLGLLLILIGTLIVVPMNNYQLTRPLGFTLIATYVVIMTLNLLTEIFWVRD